MTKKELIQKYFQSNAINISTLRLVFNPRVLKKRLDGIREDDEKRHFRIGSAIDTILTEGMDAFRKDFYVAPKKRPSGMMGIFIDNLPLDIDDESPEEAYQKAYEIAGYKWPITSVIDSLWKNDDNKSYFLARKLSDEKTVLTYDEFEEVMHAQKELLNSPFTRDYFINNDPDIEIITQVPIYFEMDGIECKALPDLIKINHKKKTITIPDVKTIGKPISRFKYSFMDYGYYLQAAWYTKALEELINMNNWKTVGNMVIPQKAWVHERNYELNERFSKLSGYRITNFEFVVTETKPFYQNPAQIFEVSEEQLLRGWTGGTYNNKYYEGINDLWKAYNWHIEHDYWDMSMDLYLNQGRTTLNLMT